VTAEKFIASIEGYYGAYRPAVKATAYKYIQKYTDAYRQELYRQLLLTISTEYKTVPDVAVFERMHEDVCDLCDTRKLAADLSRAAITDGSERDYRDEIAEIFRSFKTAHKWGWKE
jgi:coproporphyrinogen III oxidase-like Fe-S oxidoreductase